MDFEWDERKAARNIRVHGVTFATAACVFRDKCRLDDFDDREAYGEDRWNAIGDVDGRIIVVTYTLRDDDTVVRIISARVAGKGEQLDYYAHLGG